MGTGKRDASGAARRSDVQHGRHGATEPSPPPSIDHVEWASPTSIRARSRPSNLHSYLRSNTPLFGSVAASSRPLRCGGSASGGSTGSASPKPPRPRRVLSQSTRATQTTTSDFLISCGNDMAAMSLGVYGDVSRMGIETVNILIETLEERRQAVLDDRGPEASSHARLDGYYKKNEDKSGGDMSALRASETPDKFNARVSNDAELEFAPHGDRGSRRHVRSRSYEALANLEQILEARHQQLMSDGVLEGQVSFALHGSPSSDLTEEIRKLQRSFLMEARGHG